MKDNVILIGMSAEENLTCPKCGASVSKEDKFCKNCGAEMPRVQETVVPPVPPYERKFSMIQRFWKLLVSPSEAMQDIANAPDYAGVVVIIVLQVILAFFTVWGVMHKFEIAGPADRVSDVWNMISGAMGLVIFLAGVLLFAAWLVKSLLVKYGCDNGSKWSFTVAASVTGYAYIADLIFGIIGAVVAGALLPHFTLDVSSLETATQSLANARAQMNQTQFIYTIPFTLIGLCWKSYLGALGTRSGTKEKCSLGIAFVVFLVLGLIGTLLGLVNKA